jgi:hypothetical protein
VYAQLPNYLTILPLLVLWRFHHTQSDDSFIRAPLCLQRRTVTPSVGGYRRTNVLQQNLTITELHRFWIFPLETRFQLMKVPILRFNSGEIRHRIHIIGFISVCNGVLPSYVQYFIFLLHCRVARSISLWTAWLNSLPLVLHYIISGNEWREKITACTNNHENRIDVLRTAAVLRIRVVVNDYAVGWAVRERFSFRQNAQTAHPGSQNGRRGLFLRG